jgi:hypothetical protein
MDGATREIPQNDLIIFADAAEAVCPPIATDFIERYGGNKGRVTLAACDDALFPRRNNC